MSGPLHDTCDLNEWDFGFRKCSNLTGTARRTCHLLTDEGTSILSSPLALGHGRPSDDREGIVKLTDCGLFFAFLHEVKPLKSRRVASVMRGVAFRVPRRSAVAGAEIGYRRLRKYARSSCAAVGRHTSAAFSLFTGLTVSRSKTRRLLIRKVTSRNGEFRCTGTRDWLWPL